MMFEPCYKSSLLIFEMRGGSRTYGFQCDCDRALVDFLHRNVDGENGRHHRHHDHAYQKPGWELYDPVELDKEIELNGDHNNRQNADDYTTKGSRGHNEDSFIHEYSLAFGLRQTDRTQHSVLPLGFIDVLGS